MLRYVDTIIGFIEVPDEISLCINFSNCPIHCPSCHSKYLWNDVGTELTIDNFKELLDVNQGVSCICFMGGDSDPISVNEWSKWIHENYNLRTCWYSGKENFPDFKLDFDYVKLGPYKEECGGLDNPNTNQRFYTKGSVMKKIDVSQNMWYDTTDKFWK